MDNETVSKELEKAIEEKVGRIQELETILTTMENSSEEEKQKRHPKVSI